jgi:hypothetical protein
MATKVQASPWPGFVLGPDVLGIDKARSLPERAGRIGATGRSIPSSPRPGLSPRSPAQRVVPEAPGLSLQREAGASLSASPAPIQEQLPIGPSPAFEVSAAIAAANSACLVLGLPAEFALGGRFLLAGTSDAGGNDSVACRSRPTRTRSAGSHGGPGIGVRSGFVRIAKHIQPSGEDTDTTRAAAAAPPLAW